MEQLTTPVPEGAEPMPSERLHRYGLMQCRCCGALVAVECTTCTRCCGCTATRTMLEPRTT